MWHALGELYGSYGPEEKDYSNQSYVNFIKPFLDNNHWNWVRAKY